MISFRYHVVTVVGILFALAAGVVLGAGLVDTGTSSGASQDAKALADRLAGAETDLAAARASAALDEKFIAGVAPETVKGSLNGRAVVLVVASGASAATVTSVTKLVPQAGGTLVGRVDLAAELVDPAQRQLVDQLGAQLASSTKGLQVPSGITGYQRFGYLLGRAVVTAEKDGAARDQISDGIAAGLSAAKLATFSKDLQRRASLVLFVGPAETGEDAAPAASILSDVAAQLAARGDGVLVLTDTVDGGASALVEEIRSDPTLSGEVATEDAADTASGRVVAVLGLGAAAQGKVGHYGAADSATAVSP